jgi:hypothetical protein
MKTCRHVSHASEYFADIRLNKLQSLFTLLKFFQPEIFQTPRLDGVDGVESEAKCEGPLLRPYEVDSVSLFHLLPDGH